MRIFTNEIGVSFFAHAKELFPQPQGWGIPEEADEAE